MDKMKSLFLSSLLVVVSTSGLAQNPIIQTNYTADPAPMVYNDKVYLYTTHDEDNSTWFTMNDWRLYTSVPMERLMRVPMKNCHLTSMQMSLILRMQIMQSGIWMHRIIRRNTMARKSNSLRWYIIRKR